MALCPGHVTNLIISGAFALVSQVWTNFAITCEPGRGALPWSHGPLLPSLASQVTALCPGHVTGLTISGSWP
jgi:hypothetical protein